MDVISDYIKICAQAVRAGGATVQEWIGRFQVYEKGPADLVTQADLASQDMIRRIVLGAFPEHCFLGEEDAGGTGCPPQAEYRWIVDPLDGTTNYVHRVPHYAVSLALERRGEALVGAVFDPILDECFTAVAGQGAYLNGRRIKTSAVRDLSEALAATGFPANLPPDSPDLRVFMKAVFRCQAIRRMGSSSLNLCYVAAGRFDVYWSFSTKIWDVAAGALILREAGGAITSPEGGKFVLEDARFLAAANEPLRAQLEDVVRSALSPGAEAART
jgi:myo-inositol-1(or 4)-monophosphatase